jgi:hypothetical protein
MTATTIKTSLSESLGRLSASVSVTRALECFDLAAESRSVRGASSFSPKAACAARRSASISSADW